MEEKEIRVGFNIQKSMWEEFKHKAEEDNTNASDLIKLFISRFNAGYIKRSFVIEQMLFKTEEAQSSSD